MSTPRTTRRHPRDGRHRPSLAQPAARRRQRRTGARRGPRRVRDVASGGRAADLAAGHRVRGLRRPGSCRGRPVRHPPGHPGAWSWWSWVSPGAPSPTARLLFLLLSLLALSGMAMANVLLPSLVKLHFPDRIGLVTGDLHHRSGHRADGGPGADRADLRRAGRLALRPRRLGLLAAIAAVPWVALAAHDRDFERAARTISLRRRRPHPPRARDGPLLRTAVAAGVRRLRLVRPAVARQRLLGDVAGVLAGVLAAVVDPAVAVAAERAGAQPRTRAGCCSP